MAYSQSLAGIAGYMITRADKKPEPGLIVNYEKSFDRTISQFIRRDFYTKVLLSKFTVAGIPHIIFKGTVLKDVYPVKELRTYSDVDIIIKKEDREKSHKIMIEDGFECSVMDDGHVYAYKKGVEHYEIHTSLNTELANESRYMKNFWGHTKQREGLTYEFEPEFHLCYLISHIEKHVYGTGAGIRHYMDIALFLKHYGNKINLDAVRKRLSECTLDKFFDSVLYLCWRWFDIEALFTEKLSEDVYEEFCKVTFSGGTFGNHTVVTKDGKTARKVNVDGNKNKIKLIMQSIFPPYREVRRLYPKFDGKPWLLPFAWCVHIVTAAKRSGIKNIKQIAVADVSEGKKEKELLEQIGSKR